MFVIKEVNGEDQKMAGVADILMDLPEWIWNTRKHASLHRRS